MSRDAVPSPLANLLHGLVPLHLVRLTTCTEHARRKHLEQHIDGISAAGDRLTAPGNFNDRRERSAALNALAGGLAAGAMQPDGVTWRGLHWCTQPHPNCPNSRTEN